MVDASELKYTTKLIFIDNRCYPMQCFSVFWHVKEFWVKGDMRKIELIIKGQPFCKKRLLAALFLIGSVSLKWLFEKWIIAPTYYKYFSLLD